MIEKYLRILELGVHREAEQRDERLLRCITIGIAGAIMFVA